MEEDMNESVKEIKYNLYKKWLIQNIILLVLSVLLFLISLFVFKNWIIYSSFMFILMCIGWSVAAWVGMKENRKD